MLGFLLIVPATHARQFFPPAPSVKRLGSKRIQSKGSLHERDGDSTSLYETESQGLPFSLCQQAFLKYSLVFQGRQKKTSPLKDSG